MSARTEFKTVATRLKTLLKEQKVTYRELAAELKISESGLKKILNASDGSFQRLLEICRFLGVSLTDVLQGEDEKLTDVRFSSHQQKFLLEDPQAFAVYWMLVYERAATEEVAEFFKFTEKKLFSILRKLDEFKLIQLLPGGRVRVPPIQLIRWIPKGPLVERVYRDWSQRLLRDCLNDQFSNSTSDKNLESSTGPLFILRYFRVREQTYNELVRAHQELEGEFIRRATLDMRNDSPDLIHLRWLSAVSPGSFLTTNHSKKG